MKTTIEVNDQLFRRAKQRAAAEGIPLRSLLEEALRRLLDERERAPSGYVMRDASVGDPTAKAPELDWDEIRDEAVRWRMWGE